MPLNTGKIVGDRYRIVKLVGQGGFGAVYRAWDLRLNIPCALKENLDVSAEAQRQFAREASVLAGLRHPNLPRVADYFSVPGQGQYLVMDYIEGETLEEKVEQNGPLPVAQVLDWLGQICDALAYLHSQEPPIIHRDVKPGNIAITPKGEAMLIDFGAFKVYAPHLKTTVAARVVSPGYAPVEQYGTAATDARTDVYAVGATLYAILSGQEPPESIARLTGGVPLPDLHHLNSAVSPALTQTIEAAMGVMPDQRLSTIAALKDALLAQVEGEPVDKADEAVPLPEPMAMPDNEPDTNDSWAGVAILQTPTTADSNPNGLKNQNDLGSLYDTARLAYRQNDWQQVKEICRQIEAVKSGYLDVSTMLARANREIGRSSQETANHPKSPQLESTSRQSKTKTKAASRLDDGIDAEDFFSSPYFRDGVLYTLGSIGGFAVPWAYVFMTGRWLSLFELGPGFASSIVVGFLQWLVLRKYIQHRSWYWILSWISFGLATWLIYSYIFRTELYLAIGWVELMLLVGLVTGTFLGLVQWYTLRDRLNSWWLVPNLFFGLYWQFAFERSFDPLIYMLMVGGTYGIVTAVILFYTFSQQASEVSSP